MEIGIIKTSDRQCHLSTFLYHTSFSFKQALLHGVTILISHTFLHLLRISVHFFFSFHPLPYLLNPVLLILPGLSCSTTLSGSYTVIRACQLSTVPGATDQLMEGARWAGQQGPSADTPTGWGNRAYQKSPWRIGTEPKQNKMEGL